jgi:hypothetical protein
MSRRSSRQRVGVTVFEPEKLQIFEQKCIKL